MADKSGDPFGAIIDSAKLCFFGVRDYLLGVVEEEKKEFEAARTPVLERDAVPAPYADCPTCHAKEAMREVSAGVVRCSACGWQPRVVNTPGISRAQLDSFTYPDAEHKHKFNAAFGSAVTRITGRK